MTSFSSTAHLLTFETATTQFSLDLKRFFELFAQILPRCARPEALSAIRRLLSRDFAHRNESEYCCHVGQVRRAEIRKLVGLVTGDDFNLMIAQSANDKWRDSVTDAVRHSTKASIVLGYDWGTFSFSAIGQLLLMRRDGQDRRLMRRGVGMFVRRHLAAALNALGLTVDESDDGFIVFDDDRVIGRARASHAKFIENGEITFNQVPEIMLPRLVHAFVAEIGEEPSTVQFDVSGSAEQVFEVANTIGIEDVPVFSYGNLGTESGTFPPRRLNELMSLLEDIGAPEKAFVVVPGITWSVSGQDKAEGAIYLTLQERGWSVDISTDEPSGQKVTSALRAAVSRSG